MASALVERFKMKIPAKSKFGDEGPPDLEDNPRGGGAGVDDEAAPSDEGEEGPPEGGELDSDMEAVEQLGDVLGVGPEDRPVLMAALQAFVQSQIEQALGPTGHEEPDGDEGEPGEYEA